MFVDPARWSAHAIQQVNKRVDLSLSLEVLMLILKLRPAEVGSSKHAAPLAAADSQASCNTQCLLIVLS